MVDQKYIYNVKNAASPKRISMKKLCTSVYTVI